MQQANGKPPTLTWKTKGKTWQLHFRGKKFVVEHWWMIYTFWWLKSGKLTSWYMVVYPIIYKGVIHLRWCRISEPWTVSFKPLPKDSKWIWTVVNPAFGNNEWVWQHSSRINTCPLLDLDLYLWQFEYLKCVSLLWHCIEQVFAIFPNACRQCWLTWVYACSWFHKMRLWRVIASIFWQPNCAQI